MDASMTFRRAARYAREAVSLGSRCGLALTALAFTLLQQINFAVARSIPQARQEALEAVERAIAIDNEDHQAFLIKGALLIEAQQSEAGLALPRRAHELNANDSYTLGVCGFYEIIFGDAIKGSE